MRARKVTIVVTAAVAAVMILGAARAESTGVDTGKMVEDGAEKVERAEMQFGGKRDVEFAEALWTAMDGYHDWMMQSDIIPGKSPHGNFVRLYYNIVNVDGKPFHVIVKDNFGGEDVTLDAVKAAPMDHLMAVTPMAQREQGYDDENNNWFYAKYDASGALSRNDSDTFLAGRVAKGMPAGCIACHVKAADGDYLFTND